jgi:hypothetical protein
LHIEAYHSLFNKEKKEKKQHIKIPKRNIQKLKKSERKSVILLEKKEMETLILHQHSILTHNSEKLQWTNHTKLYENKGKNKTVHSKLAQKYITQTQSLSNNKTADCSQKPARTWAAGSHYPSHRS